MRFLIAARSILSRCGRGRCIGIPGHKFFSSQIALPLNSQNADDDVESMLEHFEKITLRPPPKLTKQQQSRKGAKLSTDELSGASKVFRPYPLFPDLPSDVNRVTTATGRNAEGSLVFDRLDAAQNFISLYQTRANVGEMKIYNFQTYDPCTRQVERVRTAAVMAVAPEGKTSGFYDVERIIGIGEGKTITEARKAARMDLAERLYRVLDDPKALAQTKGVRSLMEDSYVNVALKEDVRRTLRQFFNGINDKQPFMIEEESNSLENPKPMVGLVSEKFVKPRLPLPELPENMKKLPIPKRLDNHPLPVCKEYHKILETIRANRVTIVSAATGSGKTTQIPQFLLEQFSGIDAPGTGRPNIVVTQPRRIAAKSVARRIADERGERIDGGMSAVGYAVRFETIQPRRIKDGSILFCTSGVLLRRLQSDPELSQVTHLVLDEVHERDVFTDLLLLVSKQLLRARPDLKLILMSATMPVERIVSYFREEGHSVGCTLNIEGTNYPVKEHYLKDVLSMLAETKSGKYLKQCGVISEECKAYIEAEMDKNNLIPPDTSDPRAALLIDHADLKPVPYEMIASLIRLLDEERGPGAILCFLPGWEEITAVQKLLINLQGRIDLHLVHSTSPANANDDIFKPAQHGHRKVILATNIAESSITIPDAVYVIDSGKQKIMHWDQRHRMNLLESSWISAANLRQRLGRAGRCQPGEYYSMMTEERAAMLPAQTPPELLRLGLEEVCLGLKAMGLSGNCEGLLGTAIDPPSRQSVSQAIDRLIQIGAMLPNQSLTPLGRLLAELPVHPALGRMLVLGVIFKCVDPLLTIVASIGERLYKPARLVNEKIGLTQFIAKHGQNLHSDHLLSHKLYQMWMARDPAVNEFSPISFNALKKIHEVRRNLEILLKGHFPSDYLAGWNSNGDNQALLRTIIASGLYPDVAVFKGKRNAYQLRKIREVKVPVTSCSYEVSRDIFGTRSVNRYQRNPTTSERNAALASRQPVYHVYEDLLDVGMKMIMRTTAVDPLMLALVSHHNRIFPDPSNRERTKLFVDDWLTMVADKKDDLELLSEARVHLAAFLQWAMARRLKKKPTVPSDSSSPSSLVQLEDEFIKVFLTLLSHSSLHRKRVFVD